MNAPLCRLFRFGVSALIYLGAFQAASGQTNVRAGFGEIAGANLRHPITHNIYDQVLMTGPSVTVAADPGEIVRVSFVDADDDITQVEFAGAGTVTIELDLATYAPPAPAVKYNQAGVNYVKGRPTVRVSNSGADTYISIFSVGRANAVNQAIFRPGVDYDGMADVRLLQIDGPQIGGVLAGNARFSADYGTIGIQAPNTGVKNRIVVGEITARGLASPVLRIGSNSALEQDAGAVLVAGGRLLQENGIPINATSGDGAPWPRFDAVAGTRSTGALVPAGPLEAQFVSSTPGTVMLNGVGRPTRGYVPSSFDTLLQEVGFETIDFGDGASVSFSGGNQGTYIVTIDTFLESDRVFARLNGGYSYAVSGVDQNRMTFAMTFGHITISVGEESFSGTLFDLAHEIEEPVPLSISATATYTSTTTGSYAMTITFTDGTQQRVSGTFDEQNGLQFGFL